MNTLASRIRFLLESTNPPTKGNELAKYCKIAPPSVSDWLNGKTKKLEGSNLLSVSRFFNCDQDWLATGKGIPFHNKKNSVTKTSLSISKNDVIIPQFDAVGAMGSGLVLRDQPGVIESWKVSPEWIAKNVKSHSGVKNLVIVTGFGDSMRPRFNSGDPIIVDVGVTSVDFDATYFFRVGEEGFIKILQRIPGDGIRAISENKTYEAWTIKPDMDFEVFGLVLKAWKSEDF